MADDILDKCIQNKFYGGRGAMGGFLKEEHNRDYYCLIWATQKRP